MKYHIIYSPEAIENNPTTFQAVNYLEVCSLFFGNSLTAIQSRTWDKLDLQNPILESLQTKA